MLYFAYGSNLSHKQMKQRCPGARYLRSALLADYTLVYDGYSETRKCAVANVVPYADVTVYGGLYELTAGDLRKLDGFEGYPDSYDRRELMVTDSEGERHQATVYLRPPRDPGEPTAEYRALLLEGAIDCDLPEDYVSKYI